MIAWRGVSGIWRSPDGGSTWTQVHKFPGGLKSVGQLVWALGSDHLVYAAGGSSLAISRDAGKPQFPTTMSGLPSPLKSATAIESA